MNADKIDLSKAARSMRNALQGTAMRMPGNVAVVDAGDKIILSYYDTNILTVTEDDFTLNNGGWPTRSTNKFINRGLAGLFGDRCKLKTVKGQEVVEFDGGGFRFDGLLTLKPTQNGALLVSKG
jgi:hypothetical protein